MSPYTQVLSQKLLEQYFQEFGLSPGDYVTKAELKAALSQASEQPFDDETLQELWDQCTIYSEGQAKINQFIQVILLGENILVNRQRQITVQLRKQTLKATNEELKSQLEGNDISLALLRQPFRGRQIQTPVSQTSRSQPVPTDQSSQGWTFLRQAMHASLVGFALQILPSLIFNCSLNFVFFLTVLGMLALRIYEIGYLRVCFLIGLVGIVLDIVWLVFGAIPTWNAGPSFGMGFAKFSSVLLGLSTLAKAFICYCLYREGKSAQNHGSITVIVLGVPFELNIPTTPEFDILPEGWLVQNLMQSQ